MKHYSYFLIKPDGIKYFREIKEKIANKEFDRVLYYAVDDWEKTQKSLYKEHYNNKRKPEFEASYQAFIEAEKTIYGNKAIIILVSSGKESYQSLMDEVYNTKLEIRKELGYKVGLVTMSKELDEANQILLLDNNRNIKKCKKFDEEGIRYRLSHLDVIHCPDPIKEKTLEELRELLNQGIINDRNLISPNLENNIDKYKTAEFIQDIGQNQLYTSNYSRHIINMIEEDEQER